MLQIVQALPRTADARRRQRYAVDELTERYRTVLRLMREGLDCSAAVGCGGVASPHPMSPVAIARADGLTTGSYHCADLGATQATGGVSPWNDQWGANNLGQDVSTTYRPQLVIEATLGRRASVTGDAVDDHMLGGYNAPVPGTTPSGYRVIARCNGWISGNVLMGGVFRAGTTSQTIRAFNGGVLGGELTMTDGTWYRLRHYLSNSAADYCRVGGSADTTNLGNADRLEFTCFTSLAGAPNLIGSYSLANILAWQGADLSAPAELVLDQFYRAYYGGNVTLG